MKNIVNFCKKKYKILIPIMVAIVLFVTIFFLYREYKYDNTKNKKDVSVFQYYGGVRVDYNATITYNLKDSIVDIESESNRVYFDATPIYYQGEEKKIIFPTEMTIVFPLKNDSQYKLYKYATYYMDEDIHYIKNNTDIGEYNFFFLYDGNGTFFFPVEVVLNINGKEYKKLGASSYIKVTGGLTLAYYDTLTESSEVLEIGGDKITISSEDINIDVNGRSFLSYGESKLLMKPNYLNPVFKTIDK